MIFMIFKASNRLSFTSITTDDIKLKFITNEWINSSKIDDIEFELN